MADETATVDKPSGSLGLKPSGKKDDFDINSVMESFKKNITDTETKQIKVLDDQKAERGKIFEKQEQNIGELFKEARKIQGLPAPKSPDLKEVPEAPKGEYRDPMQSLGSLASVIAMFGSLRTRAPLTSALNSAAASMQAFHQGDMERVKLERANWHDKLEEGLKQNQLELDKYTLALQANKFDMEKSRPMFEAIAAENNHQTMLVAAQAGDARAMFDLYDSTKKSQEKLLTTLVTDNQRREAAQFHHEDRQDANAARRQAQASLDEDRRARRALDRDKMEEKAEVAAKKVVAAGKPAERALEVIDEMEGLLQSQWGVTGAAAYAKRPLESVTSMFTGSGGAAHQYESLARELQNILRQTEEFRYKGKTLSKEVADRDVMVRGLKFGDTGQISLDQLQHLRNMLSGQGAGFESQPGATPAAAPPAEITDPALIMDGYRFPNQKALNDYRAAKAGGR